VAAVVALALRPSHPITPRAGSLRVQTSYLCHPSDRLNGRTLLRHALLRDYCDGLLVLDRAECDALVQAGNEEGLVALLARALQEAKAVSEQLAQEQKVRGRCERTEGWHTVAGMCHSVPVGSGDRGAAWHCARMGGMGMFITWPMDEGNMEGAWCGTCKRSPTGTTRAPAPRHRSGMGVGQLAMVAFDTGRQTQNL